MKRIDYCLYIKARNGNGYEVTKYFRIGEFVNLYREQFKRVCLSTVEIRKAFSRELFLSNEDLHFDYFAFLPVCSLMTVEFFLDKELQQFINILREKYNAFVSWKEWDNIPKRALLIGDEVIPMPPIPDEYLEDFKNSINQSLIGKSHCWFEQKYYNSNDSIRIVLYNQLSRDEQIAFSDYETSNYYPRLGNIDYLKSVAVTIEKLAQNEFEDELKTSACQGSASAPNVGNSPAAPASTPVATIPPTTPASVPVADVPAVIPDDIPDDSSFVSSVASRERVTSKTVEVKPTPDVQTEILRELKAFRKEQKQQGEQQTEILQQSLEVQRQTANSSSSINEKTPGKITNLEAIPPYRPTDKRWVLEKDYAKITGINNLNNLRPRSKGGIVSDDGNSGIHGGHIWRAVGEGKGKNGRRIFYYIQDWLMVRIKVNTNTPLT